MPDHFSFISASQAQCAGDPVVYFLFVMPHMNPSPPHSINPEPLAFHLAHWMAGLYILEFSGSGRGGGGGLFLEYPETIM